MSRQQRGKDASDASKSYNDGTMEATTNTTTWECCACRGQSGAYGNRALLVEVVVVVVSLLLAWWQSRRRRLQAPAATSRRIRGQTKQYTV